MTQWVESLVSGRAPNFATHNRTHIQLVDDSRIEQAQAGHGGSPWQCCRFAACASGEFLHHPQERRSWQVEDERYRPRLRQQPRRCPLRLKRLFCVREFTGIRGNPTSAWGVELLASIVFAMLGCALWQRARNWWHLHVDNVRMCVLLRHRFTLHRC